MLWNQSVSPHHMFTYFHLYFRSYFRLGQVKKIWPRLPYRVCVFRRGRIMLRRVRNPPQELEIRGNKCEIKNIRLLSIDINRSKSHLQKDKIKNRPHHLEWLRLYEIIKVGISILLDLVGLVTTLLIASFCTLYKRPQNLT